MGGPPLGLRLGVLWRACFVAVGVNAAGLRVCDRTVRAFASTCRSRLMKMVRLGGDLRWAPAYDRARHTTSHLSWRPPPETLTGPAVTSGDLSGRVRRTHAYPARELTMHATPALLVDMVGKGGLVRTVHLRGGLGAPLCACRFERVLGWWRRHVVPLGMKSFLDEAGAPG
uniref:Putative secreted protein n=1 Tax=Ixodes ricinus TaxID=34613 RepID=A0A6B0UZ39_IXORI